MGRTFSMLEGEQLVQVSKLACTTKLAVEDAINSSSESRLALPSMTASLPLRFMSRPRSSTFSFMPRGEWNRTSAFAVTQTSPRRNSKFAMTSSRRQNRMPPCVTPLYPMYCSDEVHSARHSPSSFKRKRTFSPESLEGPQTKHEFADDSSNTRKPQER